MPDEILAQNIALDDDTLIGDDVADDNPMYALPVDEDLIPGEVIPGKPILPVEGDVVDGDDSDLDGGEEDNDEEELE